MKAGLPGKQYTIYAQKYNKKADDPIGEKYKVTYKVTASTYNAIAPVVELGSGIPIPAAGTSIEDVEAQAAEGAENNPPQPSNAPVPNPTSFPEETPAVAGESASPNPSPAAAPMPVLLDASSPAA